MKAYYNEVDRYCCDWLSNLMDAGHITAGKIDDRSIVDVSPDDVRGYDRVHWFAGIAGWDHALNLAGWRFDGQVTWTGSCPCQPFSAAGKGGGGKDERHLWPHWFRLIRERKPAIIFGENVAAAIGWGWLDAVLGDLEAEGYATGAMVLGAHSVEAPHIRQRLWFVADAMHAERGQERLNGEHERDRHDAGRTQAHGVAGACGPVRLVADAGISGGRRQRGEQPGRRSIAADEREAGLVADADTTGQRLERRGGLLDGERPALRDDADGCGAGELGDAGSGGRLKGHSDSGGCSEQNSPREQTGGAIEHGYTSNPWSDLVWLPCTDGKARPTKSNIFPLAHGVSGRVGKLRAAGNAIVPQVAAEFIRACMP
jgi:DNA (cytosine-5)-methyltransferase 1